MRRQRTTGAARNEYEKRYTAATHGARWIDIYRKVIEAV
jgi:glycosyltransferase involved in cell wall biosynthesis